MSAQTQIKPFRKLSIFISWKDRLFFLSSKINWILTNKNKTVTSNCDFNFFKTLRIIDVIGSSLDTNYQWNDRIKVYFMQILLNDI